MSVAETQSGSNLGILTFIIILVMFIYFLIDSINEHDATLRAMNINSTKIEQEIKACEATLPRNKKCVVKYQVVPE